MEELKPVPPAPKKKTSLLVRLLAFLLTLALLLGAVVLLNPFGTMKALVVLIGLSLVYDGASDLYLIYRVSKAFRDGGDL